MNESLGGPASPSKPSRAASGGHRRGQLRLAAAVIITALVTIFAVLNLDRVSVNWLIATWRTPLIVVIVISALLGAALDRIVQLRAKRR